MWVVIAGLAILRLGYMVLTEVIPEEAYYWNYSQHLDWGYLDHPPMVAWLIRGGTLLFGSHPFGVRFGALIGWAITAIFVWKLTARMYGRGAALVALLMLSILPFYFATGFLLTPDIAVTACWAATLYYLYRALIEGSTGAWYAAGVAIGLGLLSKYTIGLLVPAALIFLLLRPESRRLLRQAHPWLALIAALGIFTPVIYWNATHDWVSFEFQTSRRLSAGVAFSPHVLLGSILLLLTPIVSLAAYAAIVSRREPTESAVSRSTAPSRRFIAVFTLVPLAVYALFSLTHEPKLNWTGPLWLAVLPACADLMRASVSTRFVLWIRRAWTPTVAVCTASYVLVFIYLTVGLPHVGYFRDVSTVAGWEQLGEKIERIEKHVEQTSGTEPLIVGMDRYNISSELAFYSDDRGSQDAAGRHLFGGGSLMYRYWFPPTHQTGKNIIMVSRNPATLEDSGVTEHFQSLSTLDSLPVYLNERPLTTYFVRVGYGYRTVHLN